MKKIQFKKKKGCRVKTFIKVARQMAKKYKKPVTIFLKPGIYNESINLSNDVNLSGETCFK